MGEQHLLMLLGVLDSETKTETRCCPDLEILSDLLIKCCVHFHAAK